MRIADLDQFPSGIGWDVDRTLVGHPANSLFFRYILARPSVKHVIISFRSHQWAARIPRDIAIDGGPSATAFTAIHTIEDTVWLENERARLKRRAGLLSGAWTETEEQYREFKAGVCHRLGLRVLIDDDTDNCKRGCDKYGITLVHPDEFLVEYYASLHD